MGLFNKGQREAYASGCEHNANASNYHADRADSAADYASRDGNTNLASSERARAVQLRMDAAGWQAKAEETREKR